MDGRLIINNERVGTAAKLSQHILDKGAAAGLAKDLERCRL
jgi:hypothetical protein